MSLRLFNTLSRRVEPFSPLDPGRVTLYTCGPTVWNYAHIGNFRTFLFEDLLRRWLEASGYEVFHIMNLTDVDDRIIKEAGARGVSIRDFVAPYVVAFDEDREFLRIRPAHVYPRATEYVAPMVRLVEGLLAKGIARPSDFVEPQTATIEASGRCAVPKASLTYSSPNLPSCFAKPGSSFCSSLWKRTFSSINTSPGFSALAIASTSGPTQSGAILTGQSKSLPSASAEGCELPRS